MVKLKVRKFGNSLGEILPKEVLQRLTATEGDRLLLLESPDGSYQRPGIPNSKSKCA